MLSFGDSRRIFLARQAVDMRKGCASLAALVENALGHDPYAGDIFVFVGRRKNRVKLIAWDRSGFVGVKLAGLDAHDRPARRRSLRGTGQSRGRRRIGRF